MQENRISREILAGKRDDKFLQFVIFIKILTLVFKLLAANRPEDPRGVVLLTGRVVLAPFTLLVFWGLNCVIGVGITLPLAFSSFIGKE